MKDYSVRNEKSRLIQATATSLHEHITELFDNGYDQGYADATIDLAHEENDRAYQQGLEDAWEAVNDAHWIDNHNDTISCSHCHTWFNKDDRYYYMLYCPYCNVKMAESEDKG